MKNNYVNKYSDFINEKNSSDKKDEFCEKYGIDKKELSSRKYTVDNSKEEFTLWQLLKDNADALEEDVLKLEEVFPVKEILELKVGKTYNSGGAGGADVKRIK